MGVIALLVRTTLRRRLVASAVLAVLVGAAAAGVATAWAGARRTEGAFPHFLTTAAPDASVEELDQPVPIDLDAVRAAPGVQKAARLVGYGAIPLSAPGVPDITRGYFFIADDDDGVPIDELSAPLLLEGRLPDPEQPDEVIVNEGTRDSGNGVGSTLPLCIYNFAAVESYDGPLFDEPTEAQLRAAGRELCDFVEMRVVGVGRFDFDIVVREQNEDETAVVGTPAFTRTVSVPPSYNSVGVELEPDASFARFAAAVRSAHDEPLRITSGALRSKTLDRAAAPFVRSLELFAVALALASVGILGPALLRWTDASGDDRLALHSIGLRPRDLAGATMVRGLLLGAAAAALAVIGAIAASPLFPIGPAADAQARRTVDVDPAVLAVVAGSVVALCTLAGVGAALRSERRKHPERSGLAQRVSALGAPPAVTAGIRAALTRRPDQAVGPVATAAGVAIALAAVSGVLTFGVSLDRLLDTPERIGWTWTASYESFEGSLDDGVLAALESDPTISARSLGLRSGIEVDGNVVPAFAFEPLEGSIELTALEGRLPVRADEIALGGQALDRIGKHVGDEVAVVGPSGASLDATIVGRTLLPLFSRSDDLTVGEGVLLTSEGLEATGGGEAGLVLVARDHGTAADLRDDLIDQGLIDRFSSEIQGPELTGDLISYSRVSSTPASLAVVLALLGGGVLAHTLATSIRGQRRDLAVLATLGFRRRDIAATVRWHALALVGACAAIGVPVGVVLGRATWRTFASGLGVIDDPLTPVWQLLAVAGGALVLALLLAALPGRAAARIRPAIALRAE